MKKQATGWLVGVLGLVLAAGTLALAGCNTVEGLGEDISGASRALSGKDEQRASYDEDY